MAVLTGQAASFSFVFLQEAGYILKGTISGASVSTGLVQINKCMVLVAKRTDGRQPLQTWIHESLYQYHVKVVTHKFFIFNQLLIGNRRVRLSICTCLLLGTQMKYIY